MSNYRKKYNVGIIGFGGAGLALYKHFSTFPDCKVVAVFDVKEKAFERAKKVSSEFLITDNFELFLSTLDIVIISSPDNTHADYLCRCVYAGKHVLCEKPLTDSIEGIKSIMKAVRENPQIIVGVQHQMRCLPIHIEIKNRLDKKELGNIGYIEGYYVHNLTNRAFENDTWRLDDNATPLIYSGIHFVDVLRWLLKEEVIEVTGMANNICFPEYPESDLNVILLKFKSGAIGKVVTAFGAARPQDHSIQIYGDQKSIFNNMLFSKDGSFEVFKQPIKNSINGRKLAWFKDFIIINFSKIISTLLKLYPYNAQYNVGFFPIRLYEHSLAVENSALNFLGAVRGENDLDCTALDAAKSVAVALAGVEAYRTGKTIKVEDYWTDDLGEL
jgi:UDP-N-acetylglucosamine 3-dehydrogenase